LTFLPIIFVSALELANNGKTRFCIIAEKTVAESLAGRELVDGLQKITGIKFEFNSNKPGKIFLGDSPELRKQIPAEVLGELKTEEALVMTKNGNLFLIGGGKNGTLYAVYEFLERQGGIRFYTVYGDKLVPQKKVFTIPRLDYRVQQAFACRHMGMLYMYKYPGAQKNLIRNRLNTLGRNPEIKLHVPQAHTLFFYIPPESSYNPYNWKWKTQKSYFETNPDFFSLDSYGKRTDKMQLCFSNPGLRAELTARLMERIAEKGGKGVFSVSAMDWPGRFCCCPQCTALESKYGCTGGPLFDYLLEASAAVKRQYPKARISTLAYRKGQSEIPPNISEPLPDNLVIIFCTIDDDFSKSLSHKNNAGTLKNLRRWAELSKNVWVWYYPLPYGGTMPFAGFERIAEDISLMQKAGVSGTFFENDVGIFEGWNFAELMTWVLFRLYINPKQDCKMLVSEFCDFYYGAAAKKFQEYISELEELTKNAANKMIWNSSPLMLYSGHDILRWEKMFDDMEKDVKNDAFALRNIRVARVMLDMALLAKWHSIKSETKLKPEDIHARILKYGKQAIAERCKTYAPLLNTRKKNLQASADKYLFLATVAPAPLPEELSGIPESKVRQAIPVKVNKCRYEKKPDAAFGIAISDAAPRLELPFTFGLYDEENNKFLISEKKIMKKDIVPDKFHLYKLGTSNLTSKCRVWLSRSWQAGISLSEFCEVGNPYKKWDIYVSLKFEGPGYSPKSKAAKNDFWCDRIILVEKQ
jgi:hypothetical protein